MTPLGSSRESAVGGEGGQMTAFEAIRRIECVLGLAPRELFDELSERAQAECWEEVGARHDRLNRWWAYGDDPRRLASPSRSRAIRARTPPDRGDALPDVLRTVPLREAFEILVGGAISPAGMTQCPFHDDRTPSCSVGVELWHCFGCGRGGSIVDLGAELFQIAPRGRGFHDVRRLIALALLVHEGAA